MRLTVIPDDSIIIKDGAALVFVFTAPAGLAALQWYGDHGTMEFTAGPATWFDDAALVAPFADAYAAERARLDAVEAARLAALAKP